MFIKRVVTSNTLFKRQIVILIATYKKLINKIFVIEYKLSHQFFNKDIYL